MHGTWLVLNRREAERREARRAIVDALRLASVQASGSGGRVGKRLLMDDAWLLFRRRGAWGGEPEGCWESGN